MMPRPGAMPPAMPPVPPAPEGLAPDQALPPEDAAPAEDPTIIELTQGAVDDLLEQVRLARQDSQDLSVEREELLNAYLRRPFGNEQEGRSNYVAGDVHTQCEQSFAAIHRQALSTSQKVKYTGPNQEIADALRTKVNSIIREQGAHRLYSAVIKDGLIQIFGAVKIWWQRTYKKVQREDIVPAEAVERMKQGLEAGLVQAMQVEDLPPREGVYEAPGAPGPMVIQGAPMKRVISTMLELKSSGPMIVPVPPEELLVERGKAEMNDRKGIGLERELTVSEILRMQERLSLPGRPFFHNLQRAIDEAGTGEDASATRERENREAIHYAASSPYDASASGAKLKLKKKLVEWTGYVESKGAEVWARTWILGRTCIRCAPNEDGIVPYSGWSPISVPHLLRGMAVAKNHLHEMKIKSSLARALMDQIGFAVDREVFIIDRSTDVLGLQNRFPGKITVGTPDKDFKFADPPEIEAKLFSAMEWITNEEQSIGPANPLVWGGSPDPREKTATASRIRSNTSMWRIDTVSLNFTEQFLVDLHNKLIFLLQENLDEPAEVTVNGKKIILTRENIQGPYACVADFQLELDFDNDRFMKAKMLADDAVTTAQHYPMLYPLGKIYHAKRQLVLASGESEAGEYVEPPAKGMEGWFPGRDVAKTEGEPGAPGVPQIGPGGVAPRDQALGQGSAQPDLTMRGAE